MAAVVLSCAVSAILGSLLWLAVGPRVRLNEDDDVNRTLNLAVYIAVLIPVVFFTLFFGFNLA